MSAGLSRSRWRIVLGVGALAAVVVAGRALDAGAALRSCVTTSARKWEDEGVVRTIVLMWTLRLLYALGVPPARLHRWCYRQPLASASRRDPPASATGSACG